MLSWFLFSVLEILLFSAHFIDVNAAKCGTVLDNLSMKIYIYVFFLSSGPNLRNIACLLFASHNCVADFLGF